MTPVPREGNGWSGPKTGSRSMRSDGGFSASGGTLQDKDRIWTVGLQGRNRPVQQVVVRGQKVGAWRGSGFRMRQRKLAAYAVKHDLGRGHAPAVFVDGDGFICGI